MKAVLMSIRPKWCELIASGKKTVEIRKTRPKMDPPFKVYIYCTADAVKRIVFDEYGDRQIELIPQSVIGDFVCDRVYQYASDMFRSAPVEGTDISTEDMRKLSCLTAKELYEYEHSTEPKENCICLVGVYGWHISNLKVYDEPKGLSSFSTVDKAAVKQCEHRARACNNPDLTNGAFLPGSYVCTKGEIDWCSACKRKPIIRPPQSWCCVEELEDGK